MNYWYERMLKAQRALSDKNVKQIEKQMKKYYSSAMRGVIADFEAVYNKILLQQEQGKHVTPADLYRLDKYWELQGQLRQQLRKLGEKQASLLSKHFEIAFFDIYYSIALEGRTAFTTISNELVTQMINSIWVADGKSWSDRIWQNTELLAEELNEGLIHTLVAGKKPSYLKSLLQERFNVSYARADALVRTEISHIQNQAAQKRYEDFGVKELEVWADEDERRCEICGALHEKRYPIGAQIPVPAHPRCRCSIIPVVE